MKIIVDLHNKSLKMLENERSIFRGEYGADKLILLINRQLANEYPTITALLSNGRKIGPYSTDSSYGEEKINGVTYTKAEFTLSQQNGFTLSEGQMQITIWMNRSNKKEAIGNVTLNVINTTAFDDGDIIVSGDVAGTLVNYKVELENLQEQVNTFNRRLTNVETNKAEKTYVDDKFNQILGEGASEILDTIDEISKALEEHNNEYDSLLAVVGDKANKEDVMDIVNENSTEVETLNIGTSDSYDETSDNEVPTTKAVKKMIGSGGSSGGKNIVNIIGGDITSIDSENNGIVANFSKVELDNKYIVSSFDNIEQTIDMFLDTSKTISIDVWFGSKKPKNSTIYIIIPSFEYRQNSFFTISAEQFIVVDDLQIIKIEREGTRFYNEPYNGLSWNVEKWLDGFNMYIKIDFDEFGIATIYLFDDYEV